jgi:hypothetical protein
VSCQRTAGARSGGFELFLAGGGVVGTQDRGERATGKGVRMRTSLTKNRVPGRWAYDLGDVAVHAALTIDTENVFE